MTGPLAGLRVVELGGIGPVPFAGMVLADLGAEVIQLGRPSHVGRPRNPVLDRGRRTVAIDLKARDGIPVVRRLLDTADVALEGFRPGVLERLDLAPDTLRETNPRLVVGRMTGYGQDGPMAHRAGHDINYIALSGALHGIGRPDDRPVPPLNLVGDFGGGGMVLAFGVLAAVMGVRAGGTSQDVDAAMVDGSALLMAMQRGFVAEQRWSSTERGTNMFDGSMPYYDTYRCADGQYVAVGAIEPQFFAALVETLGLSDKVDLNRQTERVTWPQLRELFTNVFLTRTRDEWGEIFADVDACVSPVLSMQEATQNPHLVARSTFLDVEGVVHPAPAPRFSGTDLRAPFAVEAVGADTDAVLADIGLTHNEIAELRRKGHVA